MKLLRKILLTTAFVSLIFSSVNATTIDDTEQNADNTEQKESVPEKKVDSPKQDARVVDDIKIDKPVVPQTKAQPNVKKSSDSVTPTTKREYVRNSSNRITELRIFEYHANGQLKQYTRYYGGKNLSTTQLSYNKISLVYRNNKGKTTGTRINENSHLWNGKAATVAISTSLYSYHSNGKVKQANRLYKSAKFNTYYRKDYSTYNNKGKKSKAVINRYSDSGKITTKYLFVYNKAGQLKSNKYGKAYRYITRYSKKGKKIKTTKHTYKK